MEITIRTTEMHTGGEPLRIVESGYPDIPGKTILEKRQYVRDNLDDLRKMLMLEPRGHKDMYGAILLPGTCGSDLDVLFMHNEGYSTMCGHATIALARYAVDKGLVKAVTLPETEVTIGCPCGQVKAYYNSDTKRTRFTSIPAFVVAVDKGVNIEGFGETKIDIAFGGAYYVIVAAQKFGKQLSDMTCQEIVDLTAKITNAVRKSFTIPPGRTPSELDFIYGTILTDGLDGYNASIPTQNVVMFADSAIDRSPCGSGVTARVALQFHKGQINHGDARIFKNSLTGSEFSGQPMTKGRLSNEPSIDTITVEVTGTGNYCGSCTFTRESDDILGAGFLIS